MEEISLDNLDMINPFTYGRDMQSDQEGWRFADVILQNNCHVPSSVKWDRTIVRNAPDPQTDEKIGQIAQNQHLKTSFGNSGGSANVRIDISLGDPDGTKVSVTASGEIHDDKGNYVQAAITRDYDGPANVSISGGAKKESSGNDK